ncbi:MAG: dTDP-4-dehydrorhamnose reductase [Pseudomonadota bacterium]
MPIHLLVTGATGQVGNEIARRAPTNPEAADAIRLTCLNRQEADLSKPRELRNTIELHRPDGVINAAAYTAVDRAEEEEDLATIINGEAPGLIAETCQDLGIPMLHISTDYVFDGGKPTPYLETDPIAPLGAYGRSKAAGEKAVRDACAEHLILRTAWVYSAHGNNFVKTMLRVGADRDELRVVADQHGIPTAAGDIAETCIDAMRQVLTYKRRDIWGTYHYTGAEPTTWHGFADAIFELAEPRWQRRPLVAPITTLDYPTPAARPANSVLDCSLIADRLGLNPKPWRKSLATVVNQLLDQAA